MDEEGEEEEAPPAPYQQERPILLSAFSEKNRLENFHKSTNQLVKPRYNDPRVTVPTNYS